MNAAAARGPHRRYVGLLVLAGTLGLAAAVALNRQRPIDDFGPGPGAVLAAVACVVLMMLGLLAVGALVASRRPRNPIGWLLLVGALQFILVGVLQGYAFQALGLGRPLAGAAALNWLGQWLGVPAYLMAGFVLLLFPDGRLPSSRWRWAAGAYAALGGAYSVAYAAEEWTRRHVPIAGLEQAVPYAGSTTSARLWPAFMALFLIPLTVVVARYRLGGAEERAQIRWLALAGVGVALGPVLYAIQQRWTVTVMAIAGLGGLGLPVAMAVAILRYRLYEIDRIISRTVSYGLIIATLGAVWATGVIGLGTLLSTRLGDAGNDLVVAGATLAVVILFRPLRTRVQAAVDRRFNRTGYQARQAVETLPDRLRDQVDLHTIRAEITATAITAVQPATASVWTFGEAAASTAEHPT